MTAAFILRRAWLAVVLLAVVVKVIAFVSHEHPSATNSHQTVVCDWCAAHTGLAAPPQLPQVSQLVLIAVDDEVAVATLPLFSTPSLAARPRGPPIA